MLKVLAASILMLFGLSACGQSDDRQPAGKTLQQHMDEQKLAIGCEEGRKIAPENDKPARENLDWAGKYTERHCGSDGKTCIQIRNLTLNTDGTAMRELITNGKQAYNMPVKFTWEDNGNVINVEDAGRFYVADQQLLWLKGNTSAYPDSSVLAMCKE
ncbi:hypothetical protein [Kingella denitrificans]